MTGGRPANHYSVYGLTVRSELELPELFAAVGAREPDVVIAQGTIPEAVDAPDGLTAVDGGLVLVVEGIARYRISNGSSIIVEPEPGVPDRNVRLFLLGSAFGALLHQRGMLPLHANAVEIGGRAVAFMGESGAGKSTLAARFHDAGYRVLADDVSVVRWDPEGRPCIASGLPRLRLWRDALEFTKRAPDRFERSYVGDSPYDKFDVPMTAVDRVEADVALAAIFELARGDTVEIEPLEGVALMSALYANTYRGEFLSVVSGEREHWSGAVRLGRSVPAFRLSRPWDLNMVDRQFDWIVDYIDTQMGLAR